MLRRSGIQSLSKGLDVMSGSILHVFRNKVHSIWPYVLVKWTNVLPEGSHESNPMYIILWHGTKLQIQREMTDDFRPQNVKYELTVYCLTILWCYIRGAYRKQRTFCHTKIFIDNRKEKGYAGFMTHLYLLLHIVTLDIEALVIPWHQFTYSLLVPDGHLAIHRVALISQRHEHLFAHS